MNAIPESRSRSQNWLEGFVLTAIMRGLPTYAGAVLMLKVVHAHEIVGDPGGAAIFVTLASIIHALLAPRLAQRFPKLFKYGYEPLFYDPSLSFPEKIAQWRTQPVASLQLMANVILLSLLAVAVVSLR